MTAAKPKATKTPVSRRTRIHRAAAGLTHALFVSLIVLALVKTETPDAPAPAPEVTAALGPERSEVELPARGSRAAELPDARKNYGRLPSEEPTPEPEAPAEATPPPQITMPPAPLEERRPEIREAQLRREKKQLAQPAAPAPPAEAPAPPAAVAAPSPHTARLLDRLVATYPEALQSHDGSQLIWRDGTRMVFDDGREKDAEQRIADADIEDSFVPPYPTGQTLEDPQPDFEPGRARNEAFLKKLYGDCKKKEVQKTLVPVAWLPKNGGKTVQVTSAHGVAEKLKLVSEELDALPKELIKFVKPVGGGFNCRDTARASRSAAHAYGIAIDINPRFGDYRQLAKRKREGPAAYTYRNQIPWEVAAIFEKHGFIWGAKWSHYDTAHFEYRPELLTGDDDAASRSADVPMPEKQPRNLN